MIRTLAVDLGGTHLRFGLRGEGARPAPVHVVETSGVDSFEEAFEQWRAQARVHERLDAIAIAAAGPVAGGRVRITNLGWTLDARAIARTCDVRRCLLVNDVTAIAWALPSLGREDLRTLAAGGPDIEPMRDGHESPTRGSGARVADDARESAGGPDIEPMRGGHEPPAGGSGARVADDAREFAGGNPRPRIARESARSRGDGGDDDTGRWRARPGGLRSSDPHLHHRHSPIERFPARAVIAPGTGLGVSGLVPVGAGDFAAVEGEGGHRTLAAETPREWAIVTALAERFGHASAERALSGPGIEAMWRALATIDGVRCEREKSAAEIARDAFAGRDPVAGEAIAAFTGFLGSVAGDLALTLGARGGVYIAGGIVPGWGERFDARRFLDRIRAKGRFRAWLSAVPVHVVTHPYPGLVGVGRLLSRWSRDSS